MGLSEQCCNTILAQIANVVDIPWWAKTPALWGCQAIPGSGEQLCDTICPALSTFGLEQACDGVCAGAMKTAHCSDTVSHNTVSVHADSQNIVSPKDVLHSAISIMAVFQNGGNLKILILIL